MSSSASYLSRIQKTEDGAFITGTNLRPIFIYRLLLISGLTAEQILLLHPNLTAEDIEAATNYCLVHAL